MPRSITILLFFICKLSIVKCQSGNSIKGGTSIVLLCSKDSIWIAADSKSKVSYVTNNDNSNLNSDTINCKIIALRNVISASAGNFCYDYSNNVLLFDVSNEMKKAVLTGDSYSTVIKLFVKNTISNLTRMVKIIEGSNSSSFDSLFEKNNLIQTVFGTYIGRSSYVCLLQFKLFGDKNKWRIDTTFSEHKSEVALFALGFHDNIDRATKVPGSLAYRGPMYLKLVNLIKLEVRAEPQYVGEPIDVVVLYQNGFKWLTKKRKCV